MSTYNTRIALQQSRFTLIEQAADNISDENASQLSIQFINTRLEMLEQNWSRFHREHESLCRSAGDTLCDHVYMKSRVFERCQEFYVYSRSKLLTYRDNIEVTIPRSRSRSTEPCASTTALPRIALPRINLPRFAGDYKTWRAFYDLFTSLIKENVELSKVEKMHYLKTCLTDEAAQLISSLSISGDHFDLAWETLCSRYENKRFLISAQLDRLSNLKPLRNKTAQGLRLILTTISEVLGALRALDCPVNHWDIILLHQVVNLLDSDTREAWEVLLGKSTSYPTFTQFEEFLTSRTRAMENLTLINSTSIVSKERFSTFNKNPRTGVAVHVTASSPFFESTECPMCGIKHFLAYCPRYQSSSPHQRREAVIKHRKCFNCLGSHSSSVHHSEQTISPRKLTLLATCRANIFEDNKEPFTVRLLIDQGSELSFISEEVVRQLRISRKAATLSLIGIGGTHSGRTKGSVIIQLHSIYDKMISCEIQAYILTRLTSKLPPFDTNCHSWPHLDKLQLADPEYFRSGPIQLILGSDIYGSIILPGLIKGNSSSPTAQQTIFGWVISGPISTSETNTPTYGYHSTVGHDLHECLMRFWTQEEIPNSTKITLNADEEECEQHFVTTHTRDQTGRYIVRLPLKSSPSVLGNSMPVALSCLKSLSKRFSSDPLYKQSYTEVIKEYLSLGHMVPAEKFIDSANSIYYLPHHGVLREDSTTTKLRVVFNASSRTSTGTTLNDILHTGPKLQGNVADVLLWSRIHQYIFATDVVKMFRQIAIDPEDWDLQRVLWFGTHEEVIAYRLTTVTFGLSCAPYLALRTFEQLIQDEGPRFPKAVDSLRRGRYIDDIFCGAETISELKEIKLQLIRLCEAGGFPLQKWKSNCPELLPQNSVKNKEDTIVEIEPTLQKLLGLVWHSDTDTLHFSVHSSHVTRVTKRIILSEVARLYDPLGLISPVLITAKIILQELWLIKVNWDETLSPEIHQRWNNFRLHLIELNQLSIPRWLGFNRSNAKIEIHGFSDASNEAMAAVVYVRINVTGEEFSTRLVCSKTRVAPLKRLTIPRLELTAALILARLVKHTSKALDLTDTPIFLWTDSLVALTWITANPSRWKDFVRNRVTIIQEILPLANWQFISGKQNPADCASRGLRPDQLQKHDLWWRGPNWLTKPHASWPIMTNKPAPEEVLEERSKNINVILINEPYWNLLDKYSSLLKLLRITAICRRFILCMRKVSRSSLFFPITPMELEECRLFWIKIVQQTWFSYEIQILTKGKQLPRSNHLVRLIPFIDRYGLLRVGGRLHNAKIDEEAKHPFIIPKSSPLTKLIIAEAHRKTLHGGTQVTLGLIRQTCWIVGGKAPVRSFILKCTRCVRYRGLRAQQLMGQLPAPRVTPSRPFLNTGLDYAGPVNLKTWKGRAARNYKGYLAIFICLVTSAVHLEVVTDYTTEAFIASYKRFCGRRGICATLQSDCGTNFIGADAALRKRFTSTSKELKEVAILLANDGTRWIFNPPSAPHFGGKWEAAVKSTKFHLLRVIGDTALTYEELTTVIIQIEAVLNSRPLCPLSDDVTDYAALTPGHFLIGGAPTIIPEPNLSTEPMSKLTRWQLLRQRVDLFWSRWSTECLQRYQAISKWHHPTNNIKEGSLVLITDERFPPSKWPLARIITLHPGPDGLTRVVTLRTASSTFKRPIAKVCVLPTDPNDNSTTLLSKGGKCCDDSSQTFDALKVIDSEVMVTKI